MTPIRRPRLILEMDGPLFEGEPGYWKSYSDAASALGLPRTDRARFWRLIRSAKPADQWVAGAKPKQIAALKQQFIAGLEHDASLSISVIQPDASEAMRRLAKLANCVLVTRGSNRGARQRLLDAAGLSVHFLEMHGLSAEGGRRVERLKQINAESDVVLVAAASVELVHSASEISLPAVGVSNGACTASRLTQAGAVVVYSDLRELVDELESGGRNLAEAGVRWPANTF